MRWLIAPLPLLLAWGVSLMRKAPEPWGMLDYDTSLEGYRTSLTAEQVRNAPSFSKDRGHDWSNRDSERQLHDYYRVDYYWLVG